MTKQLDDDEKRKIEARKLPVANSMTRRLDEDEKLTRQFGGSGHPLHAGI